jgi:hypothetical protein
VEHMQSVDMATRAVWEWIVRYHQGVDLGDTVIDLKVLILSRHSARDIEFSSFTTPLSIENRGLFWDGFIALRCV